MRQGAAPTGDKGDPGGSKDRQGQARVAVLCSAKLTSGAQTVDCEVLNVSAGGAKVRPLEPIDCGDEISLTIDPHGSFPGRVAWRSGESLGIEFLGDPEVMRRVVRELIDNPDPEKERRSYPRTSVLWSGLLHSGGRSAACRLVNISAVGAKVHLLEPMDPATRVNIKIERFGEFPCDVLWREGDFLGISFRDDPEDIVQIFGTAVPALRRGRD